MGGGWVVREEGVDGVGGQLMGWGGVGVNASIIRKTAEYHEVTISFTLCDKTTIIESSIELSQLSGLKNGISLNFSWCHQLVFTQ